MKYGLVFVSTLLLVWLGLRFVEETLLTTNFLLVMASCILVLAVVTLLLNRDGNHFVKYAVRFVILTLLILTISQMIYTSWPYEKFLSKTFLSKAAAVALFFVSVLLQGTWIRLERSHKTQRTNTRLAKPTKQHPDKEALNLVLGQSVERK